MIDKEANTLYQLFSMEEEEKQNRKLYRLLERTLKYIEDTDRDTITLYFHNKIIMSITIYEFHFYVDFSDKSLFQNGEDALHKQSKDRVLYYLEYIGNLQS